MFKTPGEAEILIAELQPLIADTRVEVVICPPFVDLPAAAAALGEGPIALGAQNMHWENEGAYTGEISPLMLKSIGCRYVILGHSERRQHFLETDEMISRKVQSAFAAGLKPILCVGETGAERDSGQAMTVIAKQVQLGLAGIDPDQAGELVVAYEPVWAIGTGRTASPEIAQEIIGQIRLELAKIFGMEAAAKIRIQYGGSVKPENIAEFMAQPDIDGALVGGASLQAAAFSKIVLY